MLLLINPAKVEVGDLCWVKATVEGSHNSLDLTIPATVHTISEGGLFIEIQPYGDDRLIYVNCNKLYTLRDVK